MNGTPTFGQRVRRTALRDLTKSLLILLVATNVVTGYHYAKVALDDPRDFVQYNNTYGPFSYHEGLALGVQSQPIVPTQTVYHAGDRVAWTTNLCLSPTATVTGHAELVRLAQSGVPESVVDRRDTVVGPSVHRCGPRVGDFHIPSDALPGSYEIRRWVDIDGPVSWLRRLWPLHVNIEPMVIQVVTTVYTAPPAPAPDGAQ